MPVFVAAVKRSRSRRNYFGAPAQKRDSGACCDYLTRSAHTKGESTLIKKNFSSDFERGRKVGLAPSRLASRPPPVLEGSSRPLYKMEGEATDQTSLSPTSSSNLSPSNGGHPLLPSGVEKSFKNRRTFSSRRRDVEEIVKKHPHKIPIIVERSKNEKGLGLLDKSKFLVPEELTMSQLNAIIRRRLQLSDTQAFYLIINRRSMASASMTLSEIYRSEKDDDGFLYITYASQEMFG